MDKKKIFYVATVFCFFCFSNLQSQINYGTIDYEIRVNLTKRFPPSSNQNYGRRGMQNQNNNSQNYLIENATLYFRDTISLFIVNPQEDMSKQGQTFVTKTLTNFSANVMRTQIEVLGETFLVEDNLPKRTWKSTGKTRKIIDFDCHEVFCEINDSTKIYAWFSPEFVTSAGPESYWDLPGMILGLAYEDGSVTYFAKKVAEDFPKIESEMKFNSSKKIYSRTQLANEFLNKQFSSSRYEGLIRDLIHFF